MKIVCASAWYPRGELSRFVGLIDHFETTYSGMAITLPPDADGKLIKRLTELGDFLHVSITPDWSWGRYSALQEGLIFPGSHIHYTDFDRLLRWVETRPDEWRRTVEIVRSSECLVIGRTELAYRTHPEAIRKTEAISNMVISHLLNKNVDVSAGSKGFSREAAEFLMENCQPGHALGTDGEWPLVLQRGGFDIDYLEVDGLDWESADRHRGEAASVDEQHKAAAIFDADPDHWKHRVDVAFEIVRSGLQAY